MRRRVGPFVVVCVLSTLLMAACAGPTPATRVVREMASVRLSEMSESDLAVALVCHDTLGRPELETRRSAVSRCTPCQPAGMQDVPQRSLAHARRLWQQGARAPYDSLDLGARCVQRAYDVARRAMPDNDSLAVEIALFRLLSANDSVRSAALVSVDEILQRLSGSESYEQAARTLAQFADGIWNRSQRMLERPVGVDETHLESRVHDIGGPLLSFLPPRPEPSRELGESEAEWTARLYTTALRMRSGNEGASVAERARLARLALAPWVLLRRWTSLDSAAVRIATLGGVDSVTSVARALAAYRQANQTIRDEVAVSAQFDSALGRMSRVDSSRFDSFDDVLAANDDNWRYGFMPDERLRLDTRGWSVLDPLWSTPVNEVRLERRARVAEADFRYADLTRAGQSGSETPPGIMLLRRGVPEPRWRIEPAWFDGTRELDRRWGTLSAKTIIDNSADLWRVFYADRFGAEGAITWVPDLMYSCPADSTGHGSLLFCARSAPAVWGGVMFVGRAEPLDVSLARFRAPGDSADIYMAAHIGVRAFKPRDGSTKTPVDSIDVRMWLTTLEGQTVVSQGERRPRPASNETRWLAQWRARVGSLSLMHRVEALDAAQPKGMRGVAQFTSDAMVGLVLKGFGISDVLVADSVRMPTGLAHAARWRDVHVFPNAAVIRPGQRFAMMWEVYDLTPGPDGRVRWRVTIKRERGELTTRDNMRALVRGDREAGTRLLARETDAADISYERSAAAAPAVLDELTFRLPADVVDGRHVVQVTVEDLVSGRRTTRGVSVRVLDPRSERR